MIKKELRYKAINPGIKRVDVGFFPSVGRYFRQQMQPVGNGNFELEVDLPRGKTFLHYFFNGNLDEPMNTGQSLLAQHDASKRMPLILETETFCPVYFKSEPEFISHVKDNTWEIRAITYHGWINSVVLVTPGRECPLQVAHTDKNTTFWFVRVELPTDKLYCCLKFAGKCQTKFLHQHMQVKNAPDPDAFFAYPLEKQEKQLGSLASGYQVFPDRFCCHTPAIAATRVHEWGAPPTNNNFFGGNLRGILSSLGYIADLGVDFIYLNPIFRANSNHRYDCCDYMTIDPLLGDAADLTALVEEAHKKGIKIILDVSFNHCSKDFFAFKDVLVHGEASLYKNWFEIQQFPLYENGQPAYSCWHGHKELPQFNLSEPAVEAYMLNVTSYWISKFNIDGWRLDVCTEMPSSFVKKIAARVRQVKPSAIIIGESWQNEVAEYTCDGIDGITNFSFYLDVVIPFFVHESISVRKLACNIMNMYSLNSFVTNRFSWNFLGNHDVPRLYSLIKNKEKYPLAFSLMYALAGTPVLYYGDELYLEGLGDPANRSCMPQPLSDKNTPIVKLIKALNNVKKSFADIFTYGTVEFSSIDETSGTMVIKRSLEEKTLFFAFNFGDKQQPFNPPFLSTGNAQPYSLNIFYAGDETEAPSLIFSSAVLQ